MREVTDPRLLQMLEGGGPGEVTNPSILAALEGLPPQMEMQRSHASGQDMPSHGGEGYFPEYPRGLVDTKKAYDSFLPGAKQYGKDVWELVTNFPQFVDGVKAVASGVANTVMTGEVDPLIGQIAQAAKDKYGSFDAFKDSFEKNSFETTLDLAGGLGLVGGAVKQAGKASKLASVARAGDKMLDASTALDLPTQAIKGAGSVLGAAAKPAMNSALKLGTTVDKVERGKFVDTILKYGLMPTTESVGELKTLINGYNSQIDDLINASAATGATINKADVLTPVAKLFGDNRARVSAKNLNRINNVILDYEKMWPDTITPRQAQDFKKAIYSEVNYDITTKRSPPQWTEKAKKAAAAALKEELENTPGLENIKYLNAEEGSLIALVEPLTKAANRIENRDFLSVGHAIKGGAGGIIGGVLDTYGGLGGAGSQAGMLLGLISADPKLQAKLAILMKRADLYAQRAKTAGQVGFATQQSSRLQQSQARPTQ